MRKAFLAGWMLGVAPLLAQAADEMAIDWVGYDVAVDGIVIHGERFAGADARPPQVWVSSIPAKVVDFSAEEVVVVAPPGLLVGPQAITVSRPAERGFHVAHRVLDLTVAVPGTATASQTAASGDLATAKE
jgi:hypothetical protein